MFRGLKEQQQQQQKDKLGETNEHKLFSQQSDGPG